MKALPELGAPRMAKNPYGSWRAALETLMIVAALAGSYTLLPHVIAGDGARRFAALSALLTGDGSVSTKYSLLGPIFAAPFWWLGKLLTTPAVGVGWFNTTLFGLGLLSLYVSLRAHVEGRMLRAFLLLLTLASMVPYHLTQFYGEVFTAALVAAGLAAAALTRKPGGRLAGWTVIALGAANTPASVAGLVVVVLQWAWARRKARYALAIALALGLIALADLLQRGSLTNTGYQYDAGAGSLMPFAGKPGFSYPLLLGLFSVLLSFGKGLIFYTPGLFLPVRARLARLVAIGDVSRQVWPLYTLWLGFTAGLALIYAPWWAWYGGWFWGPRFFLFACVPASFALAIWTQRPSAHPLVNTLALLALGLSAWVGINGVVFGQSDLQICTANHYLLEAYCHYAPDYSALWRPLVNVYLYGMTPRFARVERIQAGPVVFGCYILLVCAYLAIPSASALARRLHTLALAGSARLDTLRAGWTW